MNTRPLQLVAMASIVALPLFADNARIDNYKSQLRAVRPPELAREAARLASAPDADAADVVTAASAVNSASTHLVVASVAKASPKSAGPAAAAAITSQPKLAPAIVKAAVSAAPAETPAIVTASCKAQPSMFYNIAITAASVEARSSDKIIPAVIAGVPALKPVIERAQRDLKKANRPASLAMVLKQAENIVLAISREQKTTVEALLAQETVSSITPMVAKADAPPPPVIGPPFVPSGTAPDPVTPPGTELQDPGSRVYSAP